MGPPLRAGPASALACFEAVTVVTPLANTGMSGGGPPLAWNHPRWATAATPAPAGRIKGG